MATDQSLDEHAALQLDGSEAFVQKGWRFVHSDAERPGLRTVFRDQSGQISIEGSTLVVRFEDAVDDNEIERVLRKHRLKVQRPIGFAGKTYQLTLRDKPHKGEIVKISTELEQLDCVRYAEPDLVERLPPRS